MYLHIVSNQAGEKKIIKKINISHLKVKFQKSQLLCEIVSTQTNKFHHSSRLC